MLAYRLSVLKLKCGVVMASMTCSVAVTDKVALGACAQTVYQVYTF